MWKAETIGLALVWCRGHEWAVWKALTLHMQEIRTVAATNQEMCILCGVLCYVEHRGRWAARPPICNSRDFLTCRFTWSCSPYFQFNRFFMISASQSRTGSQKLWQGLHPSCNAELLHALLHWPACWYSSSIQMNLLLFLPPSDLCFWGLLVFTALIFFLFSLWPNTTPVPLKSVFWR